MIKIFCDPLAQTIQAINELYPDLEALIQYDPDIDVDEYKGSTSFPEDGSTPIIDISPIIPYMAVVEILSHEIAHVVVGRLPEGEDEHGEKWQAVMDKIENRYNEIGFQEMDKLNIDNPEAKGGVVKFGLRDDIVVPGEVENSKQPNYIEINPKIVEYLESNYKNIDVEKTLTEYLKSKYNG